MSQIFIYALVTGLSLLLGAGVGIYFNLKQKTIAGFMAFGAGVLICALTFGLMEQAFNHGGFDAVILGFLLGGVIFVLGDWIIHLLGGRKHKRKQLIPTNADGSGFAITLGTILDGIPESMALGIALFAGKGEGILMVVAIALANFPEGISSVPGLVKEGFGKKKIIFLWALVAIVCILVAVGSFAFLRDLDPNNLGILEAFSAGAILAMLADSMMPEAYEEGGFIIGMLTVLGFLTAFIISRF